MNKERLRDFCNYGVSYPAEGYVVKGNSVFRLTFKGELLLIASVKHYRPLYSDILLFNPGLNEDANKLDKLHDMREIQLQLKKY